MNMKTAGGFGVNLLLAGIFSPEIRASVYAGDVEDGDAL